MTAVYITAGAVIVIGLALYLIGEYFYAVAVKRSDAPPSEYTEYIEKVLRGTENEYLIGEIAAGKRFIREGKCEKLEITSRDGLRLCAKLFRVDGSNKTAVFVHGYRSGGDIDFAGITKKIIDRGYNALIISHRASGDSEGEAIAFGVKERFDVEDWCRLISERFGEEHKIVLLGCSMGASTVLMASELPYVNERVSGIIADCGYTSPLEQFKYVIKHDYHLTPFPFVNVADLICRVRAGWSFDEASAERAVKNTKIPILFIHGDADKYVPIRFTLDNYEACASRRELLIVSGAPHGMSFCKSPDIYMAKVDMFLSSL